MAEESERDLHPLIQKLRIAFKPPIPTEWPPTHSNTFREIQKIRDQKFDSYCANDTSSSERPWRTRTKYRAAWLAKRAKALLSQNRNEAGWRFALENDIFRRFYVDVACPECGARVWRSEFEAYIDTSEDVAGLLQERRRNRIPCTCPQKYAAEDPCYDDGGHLLFDDRVQQIVLYDPQVGLKLPSLSPDRVFGLRKTEAFDKAFDALMSSLGGCPPIDTVIRCTPFQDCNDPLLFPFLILEAKREKDSSNFNDIETQTAIPIWALLQLQEGMQAKIRGLTPSASPLVWFLASRGDYWKVYGSYITEDEPQKYDIVQLWDGCISKKDSALQLLLIVDYIVDWARDIYRPSILRQFKSYATGVAYDQVNLSNDSDVHSLGERISDWISAPLTIIDGSETQQDVGFTPVSVDQTNVLPNPILNTKFGSLRSASVFDARVFGLRLTEDNVEAMLRFADASARDEDGPKKAAKDMVKFLIGWNELISISERDLDYLEDSWTGGVRARNRAPTSSQTRSFYFLAEFGTFMSSTDAWTIVKEITYLAVTKPALDILIAKTDFQRPPPGIDSIQRKVRPCSEAVWHSTVECLRFGSPWQHFSAALSCTLLSLYSLPERKHADPVRQTEALGFGFISRSRLRSIIETFHGYAEKILGPKIWKTAYGLSLEERASRIRARSKKQDVTPKPEELSFIRVLERRQYSSQEQQHTDKLCERCRCVCEKFKNDHNFLRVDIPEVADCGMSSSRH